MSNRGQLSIEMVILIIAVLVSGSYVALNMSKGAFETTSVTEVQETSYCGFTSGFDVNVINNAIVTLTTGEIQVNPNDADSNNAFNSTYINLTDNSVIIYSLDNVHENLIMNYEDGSKVYIPLNETWKNFTASTITLRMINSDINVTINGEPIDIDTFCFEIIPPEGSDYFNFQMCNLGGNAKYYLRIVDQDVTLVPSE
ncbi:class III signal peptide-containing protein [Methanococcus maripaludis]|uniref:Uncharacterized protein (UPF0333 family) n=2 Tax=Methanococcus maripaludis TaxID=39152 RepID=A0A7J9PHT0_METMI|nr:class III signal peptide-containing protein [Methanococcus maripaludis]MBA2862671.1 uncharacterized protein (UPF0333 family) [Methanococcus maripaludis]